MGLQELLAKRGPGTPARRSPPISTSSRWRRSPTWCRWSGRTGRWCKRGLEEMRRAQRPGMRALMAAAKCEPTRLDEGDLAFRLAPRINAAGRLYRADAGVELFLTEDEARAEEIAIELSRANCERRATEREVDTAAEAARRELPEQLREAPGAGRGRRGLASRGDRDRRLAAGRAPPPAGDRDLARRRGRRARLGPQHPRLRPARRARGLLGAPRAASAGTGPPPGSSCGPTSSTRSARRSAAHAATRARARGPGADGADRRDGRRRRPRPRPGRGARAAGAVRDGQPGRAAAGALGPGRATCGRWGRASTRASASTAAPTGRSASPSAAPASASARTTRSTPRCGSRSTTGTASVEPRVVLRELYPQPRPGRPRAGDAAEWWQRFEAELAGAIPATWSLPEIEPAPRAGTGRGCTTVNSGAAMVAELASSGGGAVLAAVADTERRAPLARDGRPPRRLRTRSKPSPSWRAGSSTSSSSTRRPASASRACSRCPARGERLPAPRLGRGRAALLLCVLDEQLARRPALIAVFRTCARPARCSGEQLREALAGRRTASALARRRRRAASGF